jgi:hypothetical protein
MAPENKIPTSILVALGLVGCTTSQACLSMKAPEDTSVADTDDTWGVCLSIAETADTNADTGCDSADTGCAEADTSEQRARRGDGLADRAEAIEQARARIPRDVLDRLLSD